MRFITALTFLAALVSYLFAQSFVSDSMEGIATMGGGDPSTLANDYASSLFYPMIFGILVLVSSSLMVVRIFQTRSYVSAAAFCLLIVLSALFTTVSARDFTVAAKGVAIQRSVQRIDQSITVRFAAIDELPTSFNDMSVLGAALLAIQFRIMMLLGIFSVCTTLVLVQNGNAAPGRRILS